MRRIGILDTPMPYNYVTASVLVDGLEMAASGTVHNVKGAMETAP